MDTSDRQQLTNWIRRHGPDYLADPNITSVGIGYKETGGERTDEISLQFTVTRKVPLTELEALGTRAIPETIEAERISVPTDVLQRGFRLSYEIVPEAFDDARRRRVDPLVPGVSVSHPRVSAGTAGAIVHDRHTGEPVLLSNWHVLHGPDGAIGDAALQPGTHDDNRATDNRFGRLLRSHLGAAGDAAIATIDNRGADPTILELDIVPDQIGDPDLGDQVVKSGRTTGVSHGQVSRIETLVSIDYGDGTGEQQIGCFEIEPDPRRSGTSDRLSDGGDSGAVWMLKAGNGHTSTVMGGLHFAGSDSAEGERALACYASSVRDKLEFSLSAEVADESATAEATGGGFDEEFLSLPVAVPELGKDLASDAVEVDGSPVVPYTHFSLTQSRSRRLARWVAWNVDGTGLRRLSRDGIEFRYDERIDEEFQAGDDLYGANDLDRGHIARRSDLLWGPRGEAQRANEDSFSFTNIAPQMNTFNQSGLAGVWGKLEDALFDRVEVEDLRIAVVAGPVFKESDREYRGFQVPREFYKIIYYVVGGELRAQSFLLSQDLSDLEVLDLSEFATYQVARAELEERTGLTFAAAAAGDGPDGSGPEAERSRALGSVDQIAW
ncbi:DNA/RNA non-specific endonuclease [Georgenia sp. Z1344]|uniref:DNA/RNA non-specific endonuclease n=1 Tax=Georgenia sp. Z1344 TaxID=3416706 RepID=UPI003CE99749